MPVGTAPRNAALFTPYYSIDGSSYTQFTEGTDVELPEIARKMIERLLLGGTAVDVYPARLDYGMLTLKTEYGSALFNTVLGWETNKTLLYIKLEADDTGGTNNAKFIFTGYVTITPPSAHGQDATAEIVLKMRCKSFAFTAAV